MTNSNQRRSESPVTVRTLQKMKEEGRRITMLTAYDFPMAKTLDESGVDVLLVGDSLGMVVQGRETTVPVTVNDMIYHGEMVARAASRAMVVVDLPFPVGSVDVSHTIRTAARIVKKTDCTAVKLEGGSQQSASLTGLVNAGIATIAHIGLRPQSVHALGGYRVQRERDQLMVDAESAVESGAFALLMECVPAEIAAEITQQFPVPTIGIGAGVGCDGQVLVTNDMLGWNSGYVPKFVRQYADLANQTKEAIEAFCQDVRNQKFPGDSESF